jgi:hypothetical protein
MAFSFRNSREQQGASDRKQAPVTPKMEQNSARNHPALFFIPNQPLGAPLGVTLDYRHGNPMKTTILPSDNRGGGPALMAYDRLFRTGDKIKPLNLDRCGYRLTARYVNAGGKYKIFELLPIDSAHEAEVSFLTPDIKLHGVIIANAYHEHKARLKISLPNNYGTKGNFRPKTGAWPGDARQHGLAQQ